MWKVIIVLLALAFGIAWGTGALQADMASHRDAAHARCTEMLAEARQQVGGAAAEARDPESYRMRMAMALGFGPLAQEYRARRCEILTPLPPARAARRGTSARGNWAPDDDGW